MNHETIEELLSEGFYDYSKVSPKDNQEGNQFLCVCKANGYGDAVHFFYECRVWSAGFFYDEDEAKGNEPADVLFFKALPQFYTENV